jgi:hypothetical protein
MKPVDLTVRETIDDQDFLAAPELKEALDALQADDDWTKLQDLIVYHWSSALRQCAKDVLEAAVRISELNQAIDDRRKQYAQRVSTYERNS